ncbi:hypothetical protein PILCRDRAFT_825650 [Piloderma croceum F 1598]|uniref:Uncharacterized protein n=1 Tax=Piloderma croceum (strain F 1598) TaxID=765440 RepID=A0A0C3FBP3_PILCF|nr:hypothetical protein PILCRDRAFT_825650 [Piloderma croceum F 1598]
MLNPPTSYYSSTYSLAFHTFASAFEPNGIIPMQYISTYQIIDSHRGVSLGFNTVGRLWDDRCVVIILTTSTVQFTSIFFPVQFAVTPPTDRYPLVHHPRFLRITGFSYDYFRFKVSVNINSFPDHSTIFVDYRHIII